MFCKRLLLFLTLIGSLLDVRIASACSCAGKASVLQAYEGAEVVVIARAVSLEASEHAEGYGGIGATKMVVERVFKGALKVGDEMTFGQGAGSDCIWGFSKEAVGQRFLFYLAPRRGNQWFATVCGRSAALPDAGEATDDLLYLNRLEELRGKTRISGTIQFIRGSEVGLAGRAVRVIGNDRVYELKTNAQGVYEIYGLPPGKYLIEPEVPAGWKLGFLSTHGSSLPRGDHARSGNKIPIGLEDKKHAGVDVAFELDNAIRGRVFDPDGNPMKDVCIDAVLTQGKGQPEAFDCTKEDGSFALQTLPRGSYLLAVNREGKASSRQPFKTLYYPNAFEREKAVAVAIKEGEVLQDVNIYVPKLEDTITVQGVLLYSDEKPVARAFVQFRAGNARQDVDGEAHSSTDANGRFSVKVLKGLKGRLYGEMFAYVGEFENCPQLDNVIKKTGQIVQTPAVEIPAEADVSDLELRYPFPSCKRAR